MISYNKRRFLIVDDFSDFRGSVKAMLNQMAAQHVDAAANGEEAIKLCREQQYDIILHDYNLGEGKNGQQVLEELHHEGLISPNCIFVMVTAESSQAMVMAALEFEPDAYLTKPFTRASLQQRLDKLVERKTALQPILAPLAKQQYGAVLQACEQIIASQPRYAPLCQRYKADALKTLGLHEELQAQLQSLLADRPMPWALNMLANHWLERGELEQAEACLEQGISQFPMLPALFDGLARVKLAKGELLKAQVFLEQAVKISPNNPQRQAELGKLARANNDPDRAVRAYRQAVNLGRHSQFRDPEHHLNLAGSLQDQSGDTAPAPKVLLEIRQTLGDLSKSWRHDPGLTARADLAQAKSLVKAGKQGEADELVRNAAGKLGKLDTFFSAEAALEVASQLRELGQPEQADAVLGTCAEMYGDDPKVMAGISAQTSNPTILQAGDQAQSHNRAGVQHYQKQQYAEALDSFRAAAALQPRNISFALNTAQSLLRLLLSAPTDELREECQACLEQVRSMPKSDHRYERYRKLCERVEAL
ncbi:MAG: response regulator [Halopseudomonas sp.]|uniref:response regulator n=1 Tax=Halopseudomonas sp. TaxID=2901191 RepID=UPI0030015E52